MKDDDGKEIWEGYCIDFIKKLSEEMQFDYDLVVPEDRQFGKKLSNGQWNGLIGDLAKGVNMFLNNSNYSAVLDFRSVKASFVKEENEVI